MPIYTSLLIKIESLIALKEITDDFGLEYSKILENSKIHEMKNLDGRSSIK